MSSLLLTWYGDDFSGSSDVLEALGLAGVRAALFLAPPTSAQMARYPDLQAVGVAGVSRSLPVEQMQGELSRAFRGLVRLGAPLLHYKVCSTFDSSPQIGSIGRAIDVGLAATGSRFVPLLVGVPVHGRYCVFGNLFARSPLDGAVYRLDRHPTMSQHPVTPMDESDLRRVLARQTGRRVELLDVVSVAAGPPAAERRLAELLDAGAEVVLLDVIEEAQLPTLGRLISGRAKFVVGSSGVEYALAARWARDGLLDSPPPPSAAAPARQIVVVSGSCSLITAAQIDAAVQQGFAEIGVDPSRWLDPAAAAADLPRLVAQARRQLDAGHSVVVHTSKGPDDPRIAAVRRILDADSGQHESARRLGGMLGRLLRRVIEEAGVPRVVVAGGDTAGYVARELGVEALTLSAPATPGAPLCRVHAAEPDSPLEGVEVVFKGGQVGTADFFTRLAGGATGGEPG